MGHKMSKRLIALLTAVIVLAASVIPGGVTVKAENQILTGVIAYINAPMPDDMPSAEVLQCSPHAEVSDCVWYKGTVTKGNFDSATKQTGEFEYGQSYTVRVTINAEEGYEFIEATSVFINGRFAEVDTWNESATTVYYTFFLPDQLTEFIDYDWRPETHTLKITGNGGLEADLSKGYPPFYGNLNIKNIVLGEGITSLEESYFGECNNIETIKIPATMTYIGHMYDGITKKGYEVADGNTVYSAKDGSLYSKDATVLYDYVQNDATEFTIPDGVETIEDNAFGKDISLDRLILAGENLELGSGAIYGATIKSIIVEEGVKTLGEQWLEGFEDTEVSIPASVESIVARSFLTSPSIEKIHVADDNPNYLDVDGVLITKDGLLDVYPAGKKDTSYRTPEQVNKIDTYGISNNPYLEKIVLSKEVGSVAGSGIYSLDNLESIVVVNPECKFIADSVKECKSLTYVYATENKSAYNWAMFNGYTPKNITHDLKHITLVPATLEADGTKEYYVCRNCDEQFWDAEAKEAVTPEDEFRIPAVDSVTISASECTVAEFSGSKPTVTVKDADGNVLVSGTDYKVSWPSGAGMGVLDVTVTGQGSYQFEKKISCTVHPSSTLRLPDNESEYDHGSQTIDLLNKACQIRGDERILIYASAYGLGVIDGLFNIDFKMGNMLLDIDKDGNFDLSISGLADLYKEDDSPMTISVLSTCSVDENCNYTLSDAAKAALQGKTETDYVAPYYGKLSIELSEPCAKGHTYTDVWNKDAAGHWHVCSICGEKEAAQPHVPGQAATATTPQTCTICGYEISPALGEATPAPGEATPTPGSGTPAPGDATPTLGSGAPAPGDATPTPGSGAPAPGDATPAPGNGTPAPGNSTPATDNKAPVQKPEDTNEVPVTGKIITYKKAVYKVTGTDTAAPTVEYIKPVGTAVKNIVVPDTVKSGGITYKVTSISKNAFKNNKKISKVIIGKNVTKIGKYAFYGCKKLKNITIKTSKLSGKNIGAKAFKGIHGKAVIKVPKAKLKVYKAVLKKKGTGKGVKVK